MMLGHNVEERSQEVTDICVTERNILIIKKREKISHGPMNIKKS